MDNSCVGARSIIAEVQLAGLATQQQWVPPSLQHQFDSQPMQCQRPVSLQANDERKLNGIAKHHRDCGILCACMKQPLCMV